MGATERCVERGALYEGEGRCCHTRLGVAELRVEGVTSREVADGPGLRVMFALGEEWLLLGALKVDFSVRLPLASGLADVLALRLDLVEPVRLGDAATTPLLRERLLLPPERP